MPQNSVQTNFTSAFPGMNADTSDSGDNYLSRFSGETTLQIPHGRMVMVGSSDRLAVSLTSAANVRKMLGIVAYNPMAQVSSQFNSNTALADTNGNTGYVGTAPMRIKYRGRLWVPITTDVDPTLGVHVSIDSTGGGIGTFRATGSAGHTIDLSKLARWFNTQTAAGLACAVLDFDLRMVGLAVAD